MMFENLFRQDALKFTGRNKLGSVLVTQPVALTVMSLVLFAITASASLYLWFGEYARKETVYGYLEPPNGVADVYPKVGGVVQAVLVRQGDFIKAGQKLITLSFPEALYDGQDAMKIQLEEYLSQVERHESQFSRTEQFYNAELKRLKEQLQERLTEQHKQVQYLTLQQKRVEVANSLLDAARKLGRNGAIAKSQLLQNRAEVYDEEKEALEIEQTLLQIEASRRALHHEINQLPGKKSIALGEIDLQISRTKQLIAEAKRSKEQILIAPIDGRVGFIQAAVGHAAKPGIPLLSILPKDTGLKAVLLVPSSAIGFISTGQTVRLMLDAFPHQQFGTHPAKLSQVSDSLIAPKELNGPIQVSMPVYVVHGELDSDIIRVKGEQRPLQAGMSLKADIILEKRSFLDWLLEPLYSLRGRQS